MAKAKNKKKHQKKHKPLKIDVIDIKNGHACEGVKTPKGFMRSSGDAIKLEAGKSQAKIHHATELRKCEMKADIESLKNKQAPEFIMSRVYELMNRVKKKGLDISMELKIVFPSNAVDSTEQAPVENADPLSP